MPTRAKHIVFATMTTIAALIGLFLLLAWWRGRTDPLRLGQNLNRLAWEASFTEFGLKAPPSGPREGYWGRRLGAKIADPVVGWHERRLSLPGLVESDAEGLEHDTSRLPPRYRILIVGGSVAWGASGSSIETTYFHRLGQALENRGFPSKIDVFAGGAWKSIQDIQAFRMRVAQSRYDLVVFINGLNDLTNGARARLLYGEKVPTRDGSDWTPLYHEHDYDLRVSDYLENTKRAAGLAADLGIRMLVVLQPSLLEKQRRTRIENVLLESSLRPHASAQALLESYERMRAGLRELATAGSIDFLDGSRAFGGEKRTVFSDMWHFSDVGQERFAAILAERVARDLAPAQVGVTGPSP